jgi:hypothetical protein
MSTAIGVVYHRQNAGMFEAERRTLIKADQVFTNDDSPRFISLTNAISVISASNAVLYTRKKSPAGGTPALPASEWMPGPPIALKVKDTAWHTERSQWSIGPNSARSLHTQQSLRSNGSDAEDQKPENDGIKKLTEDLKKTAGRNLIGTNRADINGDGRKDFLLWQTLLGVESKTDLYVFLRGADSKLPERPNQVLHCRGFPIPVGSTHDASPIGDPDGNGTPELLLTELKTTLTSADSIVNMALSGGLECALTIRTLNGNAFSGTPTASIPIRTIMPVTTFTPVEEMDYWPFFICGDFDGDGRPDLAVKRSTTQWNIIVSTADGHWFNSRPAMTFETPFQGNLEIRDINGDGRADVVQRAPDDPRISICLSRGRPTNTQRR